MVRQRTSGWRLRAATRSARGMVTTETAIALPALLFVALGLLWLLGLLVTQGQVVHAAREGARAAARGENAHEVGAAVRAVAPGAAVRVSVRGDSVVVTATLDRDPPSRLLSGLGRELRASATAAREEP